MEKKEVEKEYRGNQTGDKHVQENGNGEIYMGIHCCNIVIYK